MLLIVIPSLILIANCHPIQEDVPQPTTDLIPQEIQKDINLVSYIENFKNAMTAYVTSQYQNLTVHETEQVKEVIEEFLTSFARDLREAVENQLKNVTDVEHGPIEDGMPDETFSGIGEKVREEFPEVNEATAKEIVYKLRKNLLNTRNRLDVIIRKSQQAQAEFELD